MFLRNLLSCVKAAALVGVISVTGLASHSAFACDAPCQLKKVVTYVAHEQPYQVCITKYDHCGQPYHAYVTRYRTVQVPVVKWAKVCY